MTKISLDINLYDFKYIIYRKYFPIKLQKKEVILTYIKK